LQQIYLNFHGLGDPPFHVADSDRLYWLSPDRFTSIIRLAYDNETDGRKIEITFDDGNMSDVMIALPILDAFGRRASFFPLSGRIGQPGFLGAADVLRLSDAGMSVGSHGAAHVRWTTLADDELATQVTNSLRALSDVIRKPVTTVAVPFGAYDRRVLRILRRLDVAAVFTSDGGPTRSSDWIKSRTTIRMDTPVESIEALVAGRSSPLQWVRFVARRLKRLCH
jgi:peptidoglycan/xylan/chitin deacetylase (PgdA/CDA1 family)